MKKIFALFVIGVLVLGLSGSSFAAVVVRKEVTVRKTVVRKVVTPAATAPVVTYRPAPVAVGPQAPVKAGLFAEVGLAGGAGAVELGYRRGINEKLTWSGALGYAVGNKYGVVVLDPVRLSYDLGALSIGAGLSYAMYSDIITGIAGISGNISSKNLVGIELSAAKPFGEKLIGSVAYNTALGLRASLGYLF